MIDISVIPIFIHMIDDGYSLPKEILQDGIHYAVPPELYYHGMKRDIMNILDVSLNQNLAPAGLKRAALKDYSKELNPSIDKRFTHDYMDYLYEHGINPIRVYIEYFPKLILWGQKFIHDGKQHRMIEKELTLIGDCLVYSSRENFVNKFLRGENRR